MGRVRYLFFPLLFLAYVSPVPVVFASTELSGTTSSSITVPGRCDCCSTLRWKVLLGWVLQTTKPIYAALWRSLATQFFYTAAYVLSVVSGMTNTGEDHLSFKSVLLKRHHIGLISRLKFSPRQDALFRPTPVLRPLLCGLKCIWEACSILTTPMKEKPIVAVSYLCFMIK